MSNGVAPLPVRDGGTRPPDDPQLEQSSPATSIRPLLIGGIAFTIVASIMFAGTDLLRAGRMLSLPDWGRGLAQNGLQWVGWALSVPLVERVGKRFRIGGSPTRTALGFWSVAVLLLTMWSGLIAGTLIYITGLVPSFIPMDRVRSMASFVALWAANSIPLNAMLAIILAGALHVFWYYTDLHHRQVCEADLRARLAGSELTILRMQLQPHFFFNALHTVSSLMATDVAAAQSVVAALGDLVRASIDHTASQEVTVEQELRFVDRYLDIQRARFRQRLTVTRDIDEGALRARMPSLMLQPLVENAIRHGVEIWPSGGNILIGISSQELQLRIVIRNVPLAIETSAAASWPAPVSRGAGIGLSNLDLRLRQLYMDAYTFHCGMLPTGGFEVRVAIPLRLT